MSEHKCTLCKHAKLDETWGEIKCKKLHIRIQAPKVTCKHYKEKSDKNERT